VKLKQTIGILSCAVFFLLNSSLLVSCEQEEDQLYPLVSPLRTGFLQVSEIHKLYWEVCGNEKGVPVIVLHGGPGGGCWPDMRRYFDPNKFMIILFDQRGAGRSKPKGEWKENTTQLLIEDINKLRRHLGVTGKAVLFGGSWGTTLAVAYAETHPELVSGMVLRGLFLGSKKEIDHFYHGGVELFFPETFAELKSIIPEPKILNYPKQLFEMTQSNDEKVRSKAIKGWAYYEIRMSKIEYTDKQCIEVVANYDMTAFSVLENHYMMNNCFFKDNQLLSEAHTIAHIPTFIVNGRFDVICPPITAHTLASKLKTVKLVFTPAGHSQSETETQKALVRGVHWIFENAK